MPSLDDPGLSEFQKEKLRWELPKRQGGYGPDGYLAYPALRYKAKLVDGRAIVDDPYDCQRIVANEAEDLIAKGQGWCVGPTAAIDHLLREQDAVSEAAAERAQADRRLSDPARREADAYVEARDVHVPEIPETPIRRRGRPPKAHDA